MNVCYYCKRSRCYVYGIANIKRSDIREINNPLSTYKNYNIISRDKLSTNEIIEIIKNNMGEHFIYDNIHETCITSYDITDYVILEKNHCMKIVLPNKTVFGNHYRNANIGEWTEYGKVIDIYDNNMIITNNKILLKQYDIEYNFDNQYLITYDNIYDIRDFESKRIIRNHLPIIKKLIKNKDKIYKIEVV